MIEEFRYNQSRRNTSFTVWLPFSGITHTDTMSEFSKEEDREMKLSTRARYGLRAMLALAMTDSTEPVMTKEIAEIQKLPATYLEQLMLTLRKAGLVTATRGSKGGYVLAVEARNINIAQIVEALEGPIEIADCSNVADCPTDSDHCAIRSLYEQANHALSEVFRNTSLQELADQQMILSSPGSEMYYI